MENLRKKTGIILLAASVLSLIASIFLLDDDKDDTRWTANEPPIYDFDPNIYEYDEDEVYFNEDEGIWYPNPNYMNLRFDWDLYYWVENE